MGLWEWGGAISPAVAAAAARGAWGRARRDRGLPEAEGNANRDGEVVGCGCGVRLGAAFLPLFAVGVVRCLPREACVCARCALVPRVFSLAGLSALPFRAHHWCGPGLRAGDEVGPAK